jgi:hypothetical protein
MVYTSIVDVRRLSLLLIRQLYQVMRFCTRLDSFQEIMKNQVRLQTILAFNVYVVLRRHYFFINHKCNFK